MRVVLDTNVYISALLSKEGVARQIINFWLRGNFDVLLSPASLDELQRVLAYPNIRKLMTARDEDIAEFLERLKTEGIWTEPTRLIHLVTKDESDNRYVELALAGGAKYLVTGDQDLLRFVQFEGIEIVPPATFLALISSD